MTDDLTAAIEDVQDAADVSLVVTHTRGGGVTFSTSCDGDAYDDAHEALFHAYAMMLFSGQYANQRANDTYNDVADMFDSEHAHELHTQADQYATRLQELQPDADSLGVAGADQ
jgi:predicted TIM-barrel fold metal-dependent hydrolase